ncbi:MAG: urate hydroxylase PuuD [Xanthomonadales bacterium]|nr:urate hydroxylase PuuD [Xanthomonadales bacterium]
MRFLVESAEFALRWLHVIAAIAWIGESFYFVALDRGLKAPKQPQPGMAGESWSVHGGGFYHKQKYLPAPAQLPEELHWSKWKAYTTWLSGLALITLLYFTSPRLYLMDPSVAALSPGESIGYALLFLLAAWLIYDALCRLFGNREALLGLLVALLVVGLCYLATHLFSGRAAFVLVGAALGTIMSANVFFVIIPGQRRMVTALSRGEAPDPQDGQRGKQRSVHNTYFTLPVVFAMLSNHFAAAHAHPQSWIVLALFMAAGALIRQFFVLWHSGTRAWGMLVAGGALMLFAFASLAPSSQATFRPAASQSAVEAVASNEVTADAVGAKLGESPLPATLESVQAILDRRCVACHSAKPRLMSMPPKGATFDSIADIEKYATLIERQTVAMRVMPPGNITEMTETERNVIARWFAAHSRAPTGNDPTLSD